MDALTASKLPVHECPINWDLVNVLSAKKITPSVQKKDEFKAVLLEKLRCDTGNVDGSAAWQKCSQYLTLAWLEYATATATGTKEMGFYLCQFEQFIRSVEPEIPFIKRYINALNYLKNAMWAYLFYKQEDFQQARDCFGLLLPFDDLEEKDRAAVLALKSCVYMEFGPAGHDGALAAIARTLKFEPDESEWNFLKGKCMSRYRRAINHKSVPSEEELLHLRKAVSLKTGSAFHFVFCGQSVVEFALFSPEARNSAEVKDAHIDECVELMTIAALLNDKSPIILTRIAKGLMHIGEHGADLLENCVLRAYDLYPDSGLINHVAGNYYMYRKRNVESAIFHLKKAALEYGVFGAFMNLLDMVWKTCWNTAIEPLVEQFWEKFRDDPVQRIKAVHVMASFSFFIKNDIIKAISFWREWMASDDDTKADKPCLFLGCTDMTVALVGEIQSQLKTTNRTLSSDDEEVMRSFLSEVLEARPKLDTITRNREDVIRRALDKMDSSVKEVVAPKLNLRYRIPARRTTTERTERVLPTCWRQP